ncbi:ninein isoform X2 [Spea bombifrons]|uniref:ninein isoform X2 n=1 Tax=Spea bombifrons TaxID=233779 RepID=UPI00234915BC|nr:ninein isoform X2 [Spea bombifrons]
MEQDQYEAQLKELFDSFDSTGTGSLGQEELTDLCHTLQLEEVATFLQQALFQDNPLGRVHFDQFKEALIDVLSSRLSNKENFQETDCSSEAQPKYIKDGKRYGRRSVPELQDSLEEFDEETVIEAEDDGTRSSQVSSRNCEELWKNEEGEEYEAEGQLRFWNPDDLSASQNVLSSTQDWVEEKLQLVCEDLGITRDGHLNRKKLISICEQYGLQNVDKEVLEDAFQNLGQDDTMSLQDFFYEVCKNTKPLTPSSSTPYRQLKRHLSMQPYDESGRRTITPSSMTGSVGFRLFSKLDDGTGYGSVEDVIDLWQEDGVENSQAILKALDFNLEGKINLTELTMTLENELLMTKNEVYQAALTSFRSEIRYLLERADQAAREKEKLRSDLERNERFKNMMASEVDDHHAAIERRNEYNLRKLDEEYKEKTTALRSELRRERELILQQTSRQRMELEHELEKVKTEENNLRDRLTLSLKESTRLENELLETSEKLVEYETLANKLQRSLDNVLREKFGDLDPTCIEFFRQEEKLAQMRNEYERQRRELQDQIDELQLELEEYRLQGVRSFRSSLKNSLSFEMDSKNVMESDQGIGSDDCPPLNMSIEAEMAIEQMREQHQREVEHLRVELESNVTRYEEQVKELKCLYEREKEIVQQKSKEEAEKTEAQIHLLEKRQVELDAEIVTLKEAHQVAESEHKLQIHNMEAEFNKQRAQLIDQQAAIQLQLEETKRTFQIEKEELIRKAEEAERDLETKLVERVRMLEEEKEHLEHSYNEQIVKLQERHDIALNELTVKLLEQHQRNLQEDRGKMETEYNRRISELEDRFAEEFEQSTRNHGEALVNLENRFKSDFKEVEDQHTKEKAKWELEKEKIIQESTKACRRLQETLENEKVNACAALSQEKELLEKAYKENINKVIAEKDQVQRELEQLKLSSERAKEALSSKIIQLENDLKEELTERDEQLSQTEGKVQLLQNSIEKLKQEHATEKEQWNSRLRKVEALYEDACVLAKNKKGDMLSEISTLQNTICELQKEITHLSKMQEKYKFLGNENSDLKVVASQLQNTSVLLEEERIVLRNLQNTHEKTVKENVRLNSEISRLQEKLGVLENNRIVIEAEGKVALEVLADGEGHGQVHSDIAHHYVEALQDVNRRLQYKMEELEHTTEVLRDLEKCYKDTKIENGHLRTQVLLLQENLNHCTLEYSLVKEIINSEDFELPELEEAPITIPGLKMLLAVAKKENIQLKENMKSMEFKNKEAMENNRALSADVLWLQKEIQNMEEMAEASLKLENMYEDTKKENKELNMQVTQLQEKLHKLERKPLIKLVFADKEIQTADSKSDVNRLGHGAEHVETQSPTSQKHQANLQLCELEYSEPRTNEVDDKRYSEHHMSKQKQEPLKHSVPIRKKIRKLEDNLEEANNLSTSPHNVLVEDCALKARTCELSPRNRNNSEKQHDVVPALQNKCFEMQRKVDLLRCENKKLQEANAALKTEITALEEECETHNQKVTELQEAYEEMWVNLETAQNEKTAVHKTVENLTKQVSELKARNQQLDSENAELYLKNTKNQVDIQDMNRRLVTFLKQKDRKESAKGLEEWQKERCRLKDEIEVYRSKVSDAEKELSTVKVHSRFLEQENTLLKQEIETKQSAKVSYLEGQIASLKQEEKSWEQQTQGLKGQLSVSHEKVQSLEESLQNVNIQMSRIKSDLRVAQQEKEALKQEVMSLHKQLQNANAKNQVLEMTVQSSGLQNNQKKRYWDDLEQLMEQEQHILRQENERLQKEVHNTKSELALSREKIRQMESTLLSLKQQKQHSQSSMVKILEREKSSLRQECDHLQKELMLANRKISQMSSLNRESMKMENEGLRSNSGKYDEHLIDTLHSASSVMVNHSPLHQQACAADPKDQYLYLQQQLQQADRRSQQQQATSRSSETVHQPQGDTEQMLMKMEKRMIEVEQKLRIVKMLLQEKVNQLKEQLTKNTKADAKIKDLYVENSRLLKALEMSEQRQQTTEKKNYLLEEKISGLSKIVKELAPCAVTPGLSPQRRFS